MMQQSSIDVETLKNAAASRWPEILQSVAGIGGEFLTGQHGPCPKCGGKDRFRFFDDSTGGAICSQCFSSGGGDGLATIRWFTNWSFPETLSRVAEHLGMNNSKPPSNGHAKPEQKTSGPAVEQFSQQRPVMESDRQALQGLIEAKPGITFESIMAAGALIVSWKGFQAVAFPARNKRAGGSCGYLLMRANGMDFPAAGKLQQRNKHNLRGGSDGFVIVGGFPRFDSSSVVWKCEGIPDALALAAAVPDDHAVVANICGGKSVKQLPLEWMAGKDVRVVPHADHPGMEGAELFAGRVAQHAESARLVRLPFEITPTHGKDVRDFLTEGGTFAQLEEIATEAEAVECRPNSSGRTIRNFEIAEYDDKGKPICTPIPMRKILDNIGDWPRRVGMALFIEDRKEISWLSKSAALTGWLGSRTGNPPDFRKSPGFHTEVEVFEELRRTAKAYHDVETLPHHPRLENVYYTCGEITPGDGKRLDELVGRFNPATDIDRDLIVALLVSPGWGSSGNRPAFSITSDDGRGVGKSTLAMLAGRLWGGRIEVSPDEPIEVIKQRLLSAEAMTKRVANIDNVKSMKFSNAGLEALITTDIISGKRMFHGEAQRPNNLTWITTMNGVSFATDMAQRVITIKINRPTYSGNWQDEAEDFIDRNRNSLISDCIGFLMSPEDYQLASFTRWGNWERDVLSRLPDPAEAQRVIMERQTQADAEGEESSDFEHAIREKLWEASYDPETTVVFLPSRLTADVLSQVMGERFGLTKASRVINQRINEGGLRHIAKNTANGIGRGFVWRGPQSDPSGTISTDLESRLNREWRDR